MLVNFNGHFIPIQTYQLMMSLMAVARNQVAESHTPTIKRQPESALHEFSHQADGHATLENNLKLPPLGA